MLCCVVKVGLFRAFLPQLRTCLATRGLPPSNSLSLLAHSSCVLANIRTTKSLVFSETFHSFALFLTLAEISPLFAHSCEKHRGTHPRTRSKTSMPVGTSSLPTALWPAFTDSQGAVPLRSSSHRSKIYTGKRSNLGTCPRSVVSKSTSGPRARIHWVDGLTFSVWARKAPRV